MATSAQPGFIGSNGQPQNQGPAGWVPQPGQPGMPPAGGNPFQNPFAQQGFQPPAQPARGPTQMNMPHPSQFMGDGGFIPQAPQQQFQAPPQQQQQGGWPSPFGTAAHATPQNPGGGQLPGQIPVPAPFGQQPSAPQPQPGFGQGFQPQPQPGFQQLPFGQPGYPSQQQGDPTAQPLPVHPSIPQELQGRTMADAIALYNGMRNALLRIANNQQGGPPPGQPQPQPQPVPQPQPQPTPQGGIPNGADFWREPAANISRLIDERVTQALTQQVAPMLAPVTQQANMQQIQLARDSVAREIPGFQMLEPEIMGRMVQLNPASLTNPAVWRLIAKDVAFDAMMQGRFQVPRGNGPYPAQAPPSGQNPLPNLNSFFSESPGQAPQQMPNNGRQLSEQQLYVARAMGMQPEQYLAWSGGTNLQPQMNGGRR